MVNKKRCSISNLSGRIIGICSASIFIFQNVYSSVAFCGRVDRREDNVEQLAVPGWLPLSRSFLDGCLVLIYTGAGIVPGGPLSLLFFGDLPLGGFWKGPGSLSRLDDCFLVQKPYHTLFHHRCYLLPKQSWSSSGLLCISSRSTVFFSL